MSTRVSRFLRRTQFAPLRSERRSKRNGRTCSGTNSRARLSHSQLSGVPSTRSSVGSRGHRQPPSFRAQASGRSVHWEAPQAIASWHQKFPLELLRYAGANRLKVEIDYRAAQGRQGPRVVEPYSLRRTADGLLVLFVVNDHGQLRSYRVDHIAGIRPTASTFTPRFRVEF